MLKLMDFKRKKWQSKLQHTKRQVLLRCLQTFGRVLSFRKKQERSRENPSCSGTTLAIEIPNDLVEEILYRLPVKSLVRLKSVSKEWKSLIESGHVAEKNLRLIDKNYGDEEMKITVDWSTSRSLCIKFLSRRGGLAGNNRESRVRVPGTCNGLVCVYDLDSVYVYLLNPMTGVTRTLTPPRGTKLSVGFGRDAVAGTCKVVVLYGFKRVAGTLVFDLETSKWRRRYKTAGPMPLSCTPERNPVFVNGSLFWLLVHPSSEILVMDLLHTESFRTVSQPNGIDVSAGHISMWSREDRLFISQSRPGLHWDEWVLVQDEISERWESTSSTRTLSEFVIPPFHLNSAWFSQTLVSPYQSSSSTRIGSRQRQSITSKQFSGNRDRDTSYIDAPIELLLYLDK